MATNAYDFRMDEGPTVQAPEAVGNVLTAATRDGSWIDEADHSDPYLPRGPGYGPLPMPAGRWTPAHTEAARFLGECFAVGAVLGLVVEMARPMGGQRHG